MVPNHMETNSVAVTYSAKPIYAHIILGGRFGPCECVLRRTKGLNTQTHSLSGLFYTRGVLPASFSALDSHFNVKQTLTDSEINLTNTEEHTT